MGVWTIAEKVRVDETIHWDALRREIEDFLYYEAELLDNGDLKQWLTLLDREIVYKVPVRTSRERAAGHGFSERGHHLLEDFGSLAMRVERLETEYAWSEDPPSLTRRIIGNVRVEAGENEFEIFVKSNVLLYRDRSDMIESHLIAGERHDILCRYQDGWKIKKRVIYLDQTLLRSHNLAIFL